MHSFRVVVLVFLIKQVNKTSAYVVCNRKEILSVLELMVINNYSASLITLRYKNAQNVRFKINSSVPLRHVKPGRIADVTFMRTTQVVNLIREILWTYGALSMNIGSVWGRQFLIRKLYNLRCFP